MLQTHMFELLHKINRILSRAKSGVVECQPVQSEDQVPAGTVSLFHGKFKDKGISKCPPTLHITEVKYDTSEGRITHSYAP